MKKNWTQKVNEIFSELEMAREKFIHLEKQAKSQNHPGLSRAIQDFRWALTAPWQKESISSLHKKSGSIASRLDEEAQIADEKDTNKKTISH
jgi:hypothetical protein